MTKLLSSIAFNFNLRRYNTDSVTFNCLNQSKLVSTALFVYLLFDVRQSYPQVGPCMTRRPLTVAQSAPVHHHLCTAAAAAAAASTMRSS
jgi:hypothetical protein